MANFLYRAELCFWSPGGQLLFLLQLASCSRFTADVARCIFLSSLVTPCPAACHSGAKWTWAGRAAAAGRGTAVQGIIYIAFPERCKMQCSELRSTLPCVCFSIFGFHVLSEYMVQSALGFKCYFKSKWYPRPCSSKGLAMLLCSVKGILLLLCCRALK